MFNFPDRFFFLFHIISRYSIHPVPGCSNARRTVEIQSDIDSRAAYLKSRTKESGPWRIEPRAASGMKGGYYSTNCASCVVQCKKTTTFFEIASGPRNHTRSMQNCKRGTSPRLVPSHSGRSDSRSQPSSRKTALLHLQTRPGSNKAEVEAWGIVI